MSSSSGLPDLDRLRHLLRNREGQRAMGRAIPEDAAERIAHVLSAGEPDLTACEAIQAQLPEVVGTELRGGIVARLFPEVRRHLQICVACSALFAELLALERGPELAPLPVPDLTALRWPNETPRVREFVRRRVREVLERLNLPVPASFPTLVDAFFEQVAETGDQLWLGPRPAGAFGFADSRSSDALQILAATWVATMDVRDRLAHEVPAARYRRAAFEGVLRNAAAEAVRRSGLGGREARHFTEAFIELAQAAEPVSPTTESEE